MAAPAQALAVWMNGIKVGEWAQAAGLDTFSYASSWLSDRQARSISRSLPLLPGNVPYSGAAVRNYFDNLLPDSDSVRRRLAMQHHVADTAALTLLTALGRDCVGALQLLPLDEIPEDLFTLRYEPLTEAGVAATLRRAVNLEQALVRDDDEPLRLSLAGMQEKTALLYRDGAWCRPHGSTPTTHILKLPMGVVNQGIDMTLSVENEWFCSRLLRELGFDVADCEIVQFEEMKALAVRRFDRRELQLADGTPWIARLPQEDFCQVLGKSSLQKYQEQGGPDVASIIGALSGSSRAAADQAAFYKAQIAFYLLGATDGHAKNFSIFNEAHDRYRMTPLYDVLSVFPALAANQVQPRKIKLAMGIQGSSMHYALRGPARIKARHFVDYAAALGAPADVPGLMQDLLEQLEPALSRVSADLPPAFPPAVSEAVIDNTRQQAKVLRKELAGL